MTLYEITLAAMATALTLPIAALLGKFWRNGAVAVMGAVALLAFGVNWSVSLAIELTGDYYSPLFRNVALSYSTGFTAAGGLLSLFAGWAIALAGVAGARSWSRFLWLVGGVFATVVIFLYGTVGPDNGCFLGDSPCFAVHPVLDDVWFLLSSFIGPAALLIYALTPERRPHALPEAPGAANGATEA
jgi:hypothetical protein